MSKTTRNPGWYREHTDVSFVNRELSYWIRNPYRTVRHRRPEEEIARLEREAEAEYQAAIQANGGSDQLEYFCVWSKQKRVRVIRRRWVSKYTRIRVPQTREECIRDAYIQRTRMTRDGYWSETPRKSGFKRAAKRELRRKNKQLCQAIMRDEDWDQPYPNCQEGKAHIWDWW